MRIIGKQNLKGAVKAKAGIFRHAVVGSPSFRACRHIVHQSRGALRQDLMG